MVLCPASGTNKMILASQSISFQALFLLKKTNTGQLPKKKSSVIYNSHPIRIHEVRF